MQNITLTDIENYRKHIYFKYENILCCKVAELKKNQFYFFLLANRHMLSWLHVYMKYKGLSVNIHINLHMLPPKVPYTNEQHQMHDAHSSHGHPPLKGGNDNTGDSGVDGGARSNKERTMLWSAM